MKLAIVHDWIATLGGAERVLKEMHRIWPDAPIYTLFANQKTLQEHFPHADIRTSGLQRIPGITRIYPALAPLMPSAVESFDLAGFDVVLSSSVMFSKGVIVRPGTHHICYCYSPSRMLWDRSGAYERRGILSRLARHALRSWDAAAGRRPDQMIAISQTVADRISKYYRRDAIIIPPPVDHPVASYEFPESKPFTLPPEGFFLIVARLVPHKKIEVAIEAFNKLRYRLVIAGDGPLRKKWERQAHNNITFVGEVSDGQRNDLYANCKAVIIPNEEDFGLTAVEAMMQGKPVLALKAGGATETVIEGITGIFFDDPIPAALAYGVKQMHDTAATYDPSRITQYALAYSPEHFAQRMKALVK